MNKPKRSEGQYTGRIQVPLTPAQQAFIEAQAAADHDRPLGTWIRIQLEECFPGFKAARVNGEAKKGEAKK